MTPGAVARLRDAATLNAHKLGERERDRLAAIALALVGARDATMSRGYADTTLAVLHDMAPTFTVELRRLLSAAEPLVIPDLGRLGSDPR